MSKKILSESKIEYYINKGLGTYGSMDGYQELYDAISRRGVNGLYARLARTVSKDPEMQEDILKSIDKIYLETQDKDVIEQMFNDALHHLAKQVVDVFDEEHSLSRSDITASGEQISQSHPQKTHIELCYDEIDILN